VHFSQLHSANVDPDLKFYGASIPVACEFKFLGLIFYRKLTFNKHVNYLKDRFMKALNLLRVQGLGNGLCDFAQVVPFSFPLRTVQLVQSELGNQSWSFLIVWKMRHYTLVLEHLERHQFQAYMWKRVNCPLNCDVSNCVYNISVNSIRSIQPCFQ